VSARPGSEPEPLPDVRLVVAGRTNHQFVVRCYRSEAETVRAWRNIGMRPVGMLRRKAA
jgi:hypothetical protein